MIHREEPQNQGCSTIYECSYVFLVSQFEFRRDLASDPLSSILISSSESLTLLMRRVDAFELSGLRQNIHMIMCTFRLPHFRFRNTGVPTLVSRSIPSFGDAIILKIVTIRQLKRSNSYQLVIFENDFN